MNRYIYILLGLMLCGVLAGCGEAESRARISKAEREARRKADSAALKIGVMPTEDCLPILVAKEKRLFDTLGVDVRLRKYHALSECREALEKKRVEGAVIDSTLMKELKDLGQNLEGAMSTNLTWKFLTARKSRITRLAQLSDKFIAADSHGDSHVLASKAIDSLVTKKKMHIFIIQVEDPAVRLDMLTNGNIDAALLPEPFATIAQKRGARWIKEVKSSPRGVLAMRSEALKHKTRQQQFSLFKKAIGMANDSIRRFGREKYSELLNY